MSENLVTEVVGMGAGGEGIARHESKVLFVPGALLGETVRVEIQRAGNKFDRGRLVEVVTPHGRQPTPCRHDHFQGCGGCTLLHATRAAQAEIKRLLVRDALVRLGGCDGDRVEPTRTPGPDLGYRNHARFGVNRYGELTYVTRPDEASGRERLPIPIESCVVLHPALDDLRGRLTGLMRGVSEVELRAGTRTGEYLAILHDAEAVPAGIEPSAFPASLAITRKGRALPVKGLPRIHEVVAGVTFRVSAASFFQVNTDGAECLVELVRTLAPVPSGARVLDLFAGVGLFSLAAFGPEIEVIASEIDPSSAADYRVNAAGRPNAKLRETEVDEFLRDFRAGRDRFDLAVIDPPRAGLGPSALAQLGPLGIPRLVMVSCDPGSLARDLKALSRHGYQLETAIPVDQFPGTAHVEVVAVATLR